MTVRRAMVLHQLAIALCSVVALAALLWSAAHVLVKLFNWLWEVPDDNGWTVLVSAAVGLAAIAAVVLLVRRMLRTVSPD